MGTAKPDATCPSKLEFIITLVTIEHVLQSLPHVTTFLQSKQWNLCQRGNYYNRLDAAVESRPRSRDLTRFAIQAKGPDGKWTRKPLAYRESNNVHLLITRPPDICVNLVFKHIHAASSYTICRQFVPFIYCPLGCIRSKQDKVGPLENSAGNIISQRFLSH